LKRNKTAETAATGITSTNASAKKIVNTVNVTSSPATLNNNNNNNNESRNRTVASRSIYPHHQLPLSSTNTTTVTLNGGSKTTLSMASATKLPVLLPSSRSTVENYRHIPAKRRSLVPAPISYDSSNHMQHSPNVNNSNKDDHSSFIGPSSESTCCFSKRKPQRVLQRPSTATPKKT
jgi:hypothetical protein